MELLFNILFINDINPIWINRLVPGGWSIAVEMSFYLCIPFLIKYIKNLNTAVCWFLISVIINALMHFFLSEVDVNIEPRWIYSEFLYYWLPNQFPVFLLGIILYYIVLEGNSLRNISPFIGIFVVAMLFLINFFDIKFIFFKNHLFSLIFVCFAFFLSQIKISKIIKSSIGYIGKLSFSMYLIHFVVLDTLRNLGLPQHIFSFNLMNNDYPHMGDYLKKLPDGKK